MKPLSNETIQAICVKYKDGATLKALAHETGVSQPTISKYLKASGVTVRPKGRKKVEVAAVTYDDVKDQDFTFGAAPGQPVTGSVVTD